jgi:aspartate aminotransferase
MAEGPTSHLDPRVRGLSTSPTLAINETSARLRLEGRTVYRLGLGQSPFPVPETVAEELRRQAHQKDYLPVAGLPALREAVSAYHNRRDGLSSTANDVLIGPGSKELLFLAQLCYQGTLLLPSPSWVSYGPQADILGRPVRWLPTALKDDWRLTTDTLSEAVAELRGQPAMLILNYPNNPTGTTLGRGRLAKLADICRAARLLVISDEIYSEVHHHGEHASLASFYPEGTVISGGLSKWCGAGGWRLGTFIFPPQLRWLREAMAAVASETYTSVCAPIQYAAVEAYLGGSEMEDYLDLSRQVLRAVGEVSWAKLREAGLAVARPEGGFYLFPDASSLAPKLAERGIGDSTELCRQLLDETGVASLPGVQFGRPPEELTFRLATVNFDGARAMRAAAKAGGRLNQRFVEDNCADLLNALRHLVSWFA